ncbi:MAG: CcmD family protein [Candidatus Aquicultor sp.]
MKEQLPYVVGVYMGIWVGLLGYVFIVNNKLSGLKKELGALNKAVEKKNK